MKYLDRILRGAVLSIILILLSRPAFSQTFRGGISGTVVDSSGGLIPGALVRITDESTDISHDIVTSSAGEFALRDLPPGQYIVSISASGFQSAKVNSVRVSAGSVVGLPIKLSVAQETTIVNVTAAALSLDTESTTQTSVLSKQVQDVPIGGRDILQLTALQPGFAGYQNAAIGSVNGARRNGINYQIDGTDNNDLWHNIPAVNQGGVAGIAGSELPVDAVEEYTLQTEASPESGRNPGGSVNMIIKSGTNQLHGSAYYFNRNEALATSSPFLPLGVRKPENRSENRGFTVGGPILPDRTFFFLAFEYQHFNINPGVGATEPGTGYQSLARQLLAANNVSENPISTALLNTLWSAPARAAVAASPNNFYTSDNEFGFSYNWLVKFDHHLNQNNDISVRWFAGQGNQTAPVGSYQKPYYEVAPLHVQNYSVVLNSILKPTLANQLQLGVSYFNQTFDDLVRNQNVANTGLITGSKFLGSPNINVGSFDYVGATSPSGRSDLTGHVTDAVTWTVGKHQIRAGGEYRRAQVDDFYFTNARGTINFSGSVGPWASTTSVNGNAVDTYSRSLADFLAGYSSSSSIQEGNAERWVYVNTFSLFVQDSLRLRPNLSINYGLRYDYTGPLYNRDKNLSIFSRSLSQPVFLGNGIDSLYPQQWDNISPRVGFNYQPGQNNDLVIRGGFGLFYDTPNLTPFLSNSTSNNGAVGLHANPGGADSVQTVSQANKRITPGSSFFANASTASVLSLFSVSQKFHTPYTYNYYLQLEKGLGSKAVLQIGYVGSGSRHQISLLDINAAQPNPVGSVLQSSRPFHNANGYSAVPNNTDWGSINEVSTIGTANYNSLQATLRTSDWHGITTQAGYTWSHNLDEMTQYRGTYALPQNSSNFKANYGNSDYDERNNFTGIMGYALPKFSRGPHLLTQGWQFNSLFSFHGGQPFTIRTRNLDTSGTGDRAQFANVAGDPFAGISHALHKVTTVGSTPYVQWINASVFSVPANGTFGNQRRNQYFAPGYKDIDLSVFKNTPITEKVAAQLRIELYNIANFTNLAAPSATYSSSGSFGRASSTIGASNSAPGIGPGEPFNTQIALKILF